LEIASLGLVVVPWTIKNPEQPCFPVIIASLLDLAKEVR
jgi:hypothetical protein